MNKKDIIYIDVEDDITTIIDKATDSASPIVALVLPKRATVLQSIVNMKLLKKAVDDSKKKLVLITTETNLLPLAGSVGLHVAESLQSRPQIPEGIADLDEGDTVIEEDPELDAEAPIGELDDKTKKTKTGKSKDGAKAAAAGASAGAASKKSGKKLKVPDFSKFKNKMILGGVALVLLIVGWVLAFIILPKATIAIQAQTTPVATDLPFTLDQARKDDDVNDKVLAAQREEVIKTVSESFSATGEKDVGKKAKGTITVQNCDASTSVTVPAGTIFTDDEDGYQFKTDQAVLVPGGVFSGGGNCTDPGEADAPVTAVNSGDDKNIDPRGYSTSLSKYINGVGGQMTGGTSQIVKVISQADIDAAKGKLNQGDETQIRQELQQKFGSDIVVIPDTYAVAVGDISAEPAVNTEAGNGRVSAQYTFSILGVNKDSLEAILKADQEKKIDSDSQTILDTGIKDVQLTSKDGEAPDKKVVTVKTKGFAGPDFDVEQIAKEVKGKRYSQVIETIKQRPGVREVQVDFSPFWVFSAPRASRTTITIEVSDQTLQ